MDPREKRYRDALEVVGSRYYGIICDTDLPDEDLFEFVCEFLERVHELPLEKLNRWLGYVQGYLIAIGLTTVEEERNFTRPYFRPLDFPEQNR